MDAILDADTMMGMGFWLKLIKIIGLNIVLSGDNAVVIALACRTLPPSQQRLGVVLGAGAAIVMRIVFTYAVVWLMSISYLQVIGGLLLLWIGWKMMVEDGGEDEVESAGSLFGAVRTVLIADAVMSLDNVIAVAAAAEGHVVLLIVGLVISMPLVVFGAQILMKLIERFPIIVPAGAALIGWVAGETIIQDVGVKDWITTHAHWLHDYYVAAILGAVLVVAAGYAARPQHAHQQT